MKDTDVGLLKSIYHFNNTFSKVFLKIHIFKNFIDIYKNSKLTYEMSVTHSCQLPLLKDPSKDESAQWHSHDEDKGESQGCHSGLHHPQECNTQQLDYGEHVHTPGLHLGTHEEK